MTFPHTDKQTLLFLPGLLCDEALWRNQIEYFQEEYDIVVADLTHHSSVEALAQSVIEQVKEKQFHLIALSMGGYVAFELMRKIPAQVLTLTLINTSHVTDSEETKRRRRGLISMANVGKFKGVTPRLLPLLIDESRLEDESLTQTIMEMAERVGKDAFLNQQQAILGRQDSTSDLPKIKVPTLVIGGENDQITPVELSEEMSKLIPNTKLVVFQNCGHLSPLEFPADVSIHIEHLIRQD